MNTVKSVSAKAVTMFIALVCGLTTTRLIIAEAGVHEYALYILVVALPGLVAFADLGSGAVLVNRIATSDHPRNDPSLVAQVTTVGRIMLSFAAVLMAVNTTFLLAGVWPAFLGDAGDIPGSSLAAFLAITVFCCSIPLGIWTRILLGLQRNHIIIMIQGAQSPLTLLLIWLMLTIGPETLHPYLALGSLVAAGGVALTGFLLARRFTSPLLGTAARRILFPRRHPGVRVMDMGWPMLAQLLATPLSMQSQRFVLAQFVSAAALAQYAMAGQFFFALQGLVSAAGLTLWPRYAKARASGNPTTGPFILAACFAGGVLLFTGAMVAVGPWVFGFISGGKVEVPVEIVLAFGAMVAAQAALYPLGMFMMDTAGVRFQVVPTLLMAAASVALAFALTPTLGAVGPMLGNALAVTLGQILPYTLRIRRLGRATAAPTQPR